MAQQESALIGSILDEPSSDSGPIRSSDQQPQQSGSGSGSVPSSSQRVSPSHPTPTRLSGGILKEDDDGGRGGSGGNGAGDGSVDGAGGAASDLRGAAFVARPAAGLIQRSTSAPPQLALQVSKQWNMGHLCAAD